VGHLAGLGHDMKTLCFVVAGLTTLGAFAGCSRSGKPVLIILPDSFKGEFQIVKDSKKGEELIEENGCWVFSIPPEGTLYVKNDRPFYLWHTEVIRYKKGGVVNCKDLGALAGSRRTGPMSEEASTDFDGTAHRWRVLDPPGLPEGTETDKENLAP
jgi:hypothetical protein